MLLKRLWQAAEGLEDGNVVVLQEVDVGPPGEPRGLEALVLCLLVVLAVDPEAEGVVIEVQADTHCAAGAAHEVLSDDLGGGTLGDDADVDVVDADGADDLPVVHAFREGHVGDGKGLRVG